MSNNSDSNSTEQFVHNEAPGWLRLLYIKEIFPKFVLAKSEYDYPPPGLIFVVTLAEKLCIKYKTDLPYDEWEFVIEMIKRCNWERFYEIVEFIGEVLIKMEIDLAERYLHFIEMRKSDCEQNNEDFEHDQHEYYEYYNEDFSRMELYGYQSYQVAVNMLFLENHVMYALNDFGKLTSLLDKQGDALDKYQSSLDKNIEAFMPKRTFDETDDARKIRFSEIEKLRASIASTDLLNAQYMQTVETGADLFAQKKYLETMEVLFPSIEYILNTMLTKAGQDPETYRGLKDKVKWLENKNLLPPHLSALLTLAEGRNKTAHGQLSIEDEELAEVMCFLVIRYLSFLMRKSSL